MKILKSKKALSPVVASIILIAVTVAVSLAVAIWMGGLAGRYSSTEDIRLPDATSVTWHKINSTTGDYIEIPIRNAATSLVSVKYVKVNGVVKESDPPTPFSLQPNEVKTIRITFTWRVGDNYRIEFITANNNAFYQDYTAPST
jgi:flagellin-like protein